MSRHQPIDKNNVLKSLLFLTDESSGTTQGEGLVLKASNTKDNRSYFSIFTFYRKLIIHSGERLLSARERSPNRSIHPINFGCDVNVRRTTDRLYTRWGWWEGSQESARPEGGYVVFSWRENVRCFWATRILLGGKSRCHRRFEKKISRTNFQPHFIVKRFFSLF